MNPLDIRALRLTLAYTQARLGLWVGVHASSVGRWERGRHRPRATSIACANQQHAQSEIRFARPRPFLGLPSGNCLDRGPTKCNVGKRNAAKRNAAKRNAAKRNEPKTQHGEANRHDSRSPLHPRDIGLHRRARRPLGTHHGDLRCRSHLPPEHSLTH